MSVAQKIDNARPLFALSAHELSGLYRTRALSPVEVVQASLDRLDALVANLEPDND